MQVELAVPAGIQPGQQLEFEMNGQKHRVPVTPGLGPGQHFTVEIPAAAPQPAPQPAPPAGTVQVEVKVPSGVYAGSKLQVPHDGMQYEIVLPAGLNTGDTFLVNLPAPRTAPPAPAPAPSFGSASA